MSTWIVAVVANMIIVAMAALTGLKLEQMYAFISFNLIITIAYRGILMINSIKVSTISNEDLIKLTKETETKDDSTNN